MATTVNVKMYRLQELGDCFLLTFTSEAVKKTMLIDCGSFRNGKDSKDRIKEIVTNIKYKQLKGQPLDVVVATHQHNDHVSGFVHEEESFNEIVIEQVWLSWLDDPRSKQATRIGNNHLQLRRSLKKVSEKLGALPGARSRKQKNSLFQAKAEHTKNLIDDLLGFYGAAPELPAKGIEILKKIGSEKVDYLSPGDVIAIPGISTEDIKVYVLGPPKNEDLLYRKDPKKGESYDATIMSAMNGMANHLLDALDNYTGGTDKEEEQFPFNKDFKKSINKPKSFSDELLQLKKSYDKEGWRNIDNDWLDQASRLALYMDTYTNNSSLVLAIELVKKGKVLLFAADAQTGNWTSWENIKFKQDETTADSLLSRTVLYKVGHHGSHNATLKGAFEKMVSPELVAMIPVHKKDPNITKENGWKMPATNLYQRIKEKTGNRVLRMDDGFADECNPAKNKKAKASWDQVSQPKINPLFIEYTIS